MDAWAAVRASLADALALLIPVECGGCGAMDVAVCARCLVEARPNPTTRMVGELAVCSGVVYQGAVAQLTRAVKQQGRTDLVKALAPALAAAAQQAGYRPGVLAVPVPTSAAAMRRRGYRVTELLIRRAGLRQLPALRTVRRISDQRGLDELQRQRNVAGAFAARGVAGMQVLVVDDVLTTGATMTEAARALRSASAIVVGAATVAATPRRWQPKVGRSSGTSQN